MHYNEALLSPCVHWITGKCRICGENVPMVSLRKHLLSYEEDIPITSLRATPSTAHPVLLFEDPNNAHHTLPANTSHSKY